MTPTVVLWIYIILLLAGGGMGFFKAKSKASLIASSIFAALLIACALKVCPWPYCADAVLGVLLVFFGMRFAKSKKLMPAGMMSVLTVAALVLRFLLRG